MDERKVSRIYYWVSRAYWKGIREFEIPVGYEEAARHVADEGNGFRYEGNVLSW